MKAGNSRQYHPTFRMVTLLTLSAFLFTSIVAHSATRLIEVTKENADAILNDSIDIKVSKNKSGTYTVALTLKELSSTFKDNDRDRTLNFVSCRLIIHSGQEDQPITYEGPLPMVTDRDMTLPLSAQSFSKSSIQLTSQDGRNSTIVGISLNSFE